MRVDTGPQMLSYIAQQRIFTSMYNKKSIQLKHFQYAWIWRISTYARCSVRIRLKSDTVRTMRLQKEREREEERRVSRSKTRSS